MLTFRNLGYVGNGCDRQQLDLYLPDDRHPVRPLVVWIHGGAWWAGSKDECPAQVLVACGYAVASVGYRLSHQEHFPAQLEDCKAAIRWLRAQGADYGIDPQRIGVWGESAGGHLAALLGTTGGLREYDVGEHLDQPSRVQCVVDFYGPANFLHWGGPEHPPMESPESGVYRLLGGPVSQHRDRARLASPLYHVDNHSAPFLILHGNQDEIVPLPQSQGLHAALTKAGVESTLSIVEAAGHGGPCFTTPENLKRIADFLDRHLGRSGSDHMISRTVLDQRKLSRAPVASNLRKERTYK